MEKRPSITSLLVELNSGYLEDKSPLYKQDLLFILPVANQAIELEKGIEKMISDNNFICAASLTRGLMESSLVLVYSLSYYGLNSEVDEDKFYDKFLEKGRLQKYYKKKWRSVRDIDLLEVFKELFHVDLENDYNKLCDILHYSISHVDLPVKSVAGNSFSINIGYDKNIQKMSEEQKDWIAFLKEFMIDTISYSIAVEINSRRIVNNFVSSQIARTAQDYWFSKYGSVK